MEDALIQQDLSTYDGLINDDSHNSSETNGNHYDDDEEGPIKIVKKRMQKFSDSETDDKENKVNYSSSKSSSSDDGNFTELFKNKSRKSRLKQAIHTGDSSDSDSNTTETLKNEQQQLRMKNKRNKLKDKFKSLISSRLSETQAEKVINSHSGNESETSGNEKENMVINHSGSDSESSKSEKVADSTQESDQEETSVEKIKQDVKQKSSYKTTICDPDTSDEECYSRTKSIPQKAQKKERKIAKMTSHKPIRMTAKQAMENMKKIKSESNRMLREKEVSLPYHRPKALSLKDIMSRRRPAVTSDGKSLPIKMNEDQLRQYAKMLEDRQKEMMELCKSDTDEEPEENQSQPNEMKDSDSTNQSDNVQQSEDNKLQEKMEIDDGNKESNDNTHTLLETNDNLIINLHSTTTLGEENKNIDTVSKEIDSNLKESETITNILAEVNDDVVDDLHINDNKMANKSEEKDVETVNDSLNSTTSNAEMSLVYNDSIEEVNEIPTKVGEIEPAVKEISQIDLDKETEADSQLVSLHYDTEKTENNSDRNELQEFQPRPSTSHDASDLAFDKVCENEFSDDDMINMDEIDNLIENAEILKDETCEDYANSPMLVNDPYNSKLKPKLTGAPGMVIDLDGTDAIARKKLTGLELLKERFTYFAKLKTPEELEREKEKRLKPGAQHLKLKQELEEKIAEQRSLEWAKRLEEVKQQQMEMDAIRGDDSEDDIEKIEAKLEEKEDVAEEASSESEESEEEMQEVEDKPRKRNPMIDDEAEESDIEECDDDDKQTKKVISKDDEQEEDLNNDADAEENDDDNEDSSEESSESEEEIETITKKGRILKAFEDSDDDEEKAKSETQKTDTVTTYVTDPASEVEIKESVQRSNETKVHIQSQIILDSQDEDLQLAQRHKSFSDDLFTSQESGSKGLSNIPSNGDPDVGTQTFSILNDATESMTVDLDAPEKISIISESQPHHDPSLDAVVGMCSGTFSQNLVGSQLPSTGLPLGDKLGVLSETQPNDEANLDAVVGMCSGSFSQNLVSQQTESQPIGEDILNMCTGKFYDNQFVSQTNGEGVKNDDVSQIPIETVKELHQSQDCIKDSETKHNENSLKEIEQNQNKKANESKIHEDNNLKSILDELNDPEFEEPKPKKYFMDTTKENTQFKKKFIIDSDDETNDVTEGKQKKKIKKKKLEKRALQISDDEEDDYDEEYENEAEEQENISEAEEETERLVEYDSEENEVEVKPPKEKKKRKIGEFFEQEAELTSEDEWVGSGDEDERDLDRMEREEGDDDTFNQRKLQRELGQIHMRDVLDQDKREVRIIQELLFEDGDLGDGHRQRKFRWRNADGEEEGGPLPEELAETQEEEMESEEQWRKQRHERELFLRQMQKPDEADEDLNVSINRTTIIKANLMSRTMSSLLSEANKTANGANKSYVDTPVPLEKKPSKDIPSPKKAFTVFQQSYHGSLLSRGRGALARLAALATPLAVDDDAPKMNSVAPSSKRNFVFAALTPEEPKVTKRKAETNVGTPRLVKKMKTEDKKKTARSSLLDHLKA